MIGVPLQAGVPDLRASMAGQHELDGCSYSGGGGARLGYVVWQLDTAGTRTTALRGLPPTGPGVETFSPGIGTFSAGTVVTTGPVSTAQVNVVARTRLVQVNATATTGTKARSAAIAAARALTG